MNKFIKILLLLLSFNSATLFAQETNEGEETPINPDKPKSFKLGLYIGSYFANKYTAGSYDGYGFDLDGVRNNTFEKSYMYEKIINQYGGGYGQVDQIALALGVIPTKKRVCSACSLACHLL